MALVELDVGAADPALAGHHRVAAVRAHLLERVGDTARRDAEYRRPPGSPAACPSGATSSGGPLPSGGAGGRVRVRHTGGVAGPAQRIVVRTPPSARTAAPFVAEASGLAR